MFIKDGIAESSANERIDKESLKRLFAVQAKKPSVIVTKQEVVQVCSSLSLHSYRKLLFYHKADRKM